MEHTARTSSPAGKLKLPNLSAMSSPLASPLPSPHRTSRDMSSHRQSFSERGIPNSPRQRNPSLSQQAIQDLINNPPVGRKDDAGQRFAGRDWRSITLGEIIAPNEVHFIEADSTIEAATRVSSHIPSCNKPLANLVVAPDRVWRAQCHPPPSRSLVSSGNWPVRLRRSERLPPPRHRPCPPARVRLLAHRRHSISRP